MLRYVGGVIITAFDGGGVRLLPSFNMFQIIEAHPNRPVYADVFKHPPPWLASRRPICSDITSVDTITHTNGV